MPSIRLITGVPRSGTSLTLKLLSESPQSICLSEPVWLRTIRFEGQSSAQFCDALALKTEAVLADVKAGNPIELTVKKGTKNIPDNYFTKVNGKVINNKKTALVHFEYHPNMTLYIKSNTLFTACIKQLVQRSEWQVNSVIRSPLYVLLSWRSLNIPVSKGLIKIGELYSAQVRKISRIDDLLDRQVAILLWFLNSYKQLKLTPLKYEDLVLDPVKSLHQHFSVAGSIKGLKNNNSQSRYDIKDVNLIKHKLKEHSELFGHFGYDC